MRTDLIGKMRRLRDLENAIVLTHNIDCVFLESILLPTLRRAGNPRLTVFAESTCAIDTFQRQSLYLSGLGRRYRLVSVNLPPPFRFHPKAVLLAAQKRAHLFIGSGNIGFGGWRENGEIWVEYVLNEKDQQAAPAFAFFRDYLKQILRIAPFTETIEHEIADAFSQERKQWVSYLAKSGGLIGRAGSGPSLIDCLDDVISSEPVDRLWICAPYYDIQAEALNALKEKFEAKETRVLLQEKETNFTSEAAEAQTKDVRLQSVNYNGNDGKPRFLHAKFYGLERKRRVTVLLGSANCSNAAWTIPGNRGNAELVAIKEMSKKEFEQHILQELHIVDEPPELQAHQERDDVSEPETYALRALAASFSRFEGINVRFQKDVNIEISRCLIDNEPVEFKIENESELTANPLPQTIPGKGNRVLQLEGEGSLEKICSNPIWIDHEFELRTTSKERTLVETIQQNVKQDTWGLPAFNEILRLLQDHLDYLTTHRTSGGGQNGRSGSERVIRFTREDVFADDFGLLPQTSTVSDIAIPNQVDGLKALLLRYFGFEWIQEEDPSEEETMDPQEAGDDLISPDELESRKLERSLAGPSPKESRPDNDPVKQEKNRQRTLQFFESIINTISDENYLLKRSPDLIAKDLAIIAILMTSAINEEAPGLGINWLTEDEYFEFTRRVWNVFFFKIIQSETDSSGQYHGYLDRRYQESEDPHAFSRSFASTDFAAAIAVWVLANLKDKPSPREAQLALIQISAVARFPWLWRADAFSELAPIIKRLLLHTKVLTLEKQEDFGRYLTKWREFIQVGNAIGDFQKTFEDLEPENVKDMLERNEIQKGELLWQGGSGLCVAQKDCLRLPKKKIDVLSLQSHGSDPKKTFYADYLIPVGALLETPQGRKTKPLPEAVPKILNRFVRKFMKPLSLLKERDVV